MLVPPYKCATQRTFNQGITALLFLLLLFLAGFSARSLSLQLHRRLVRAGNRYAGRYRIAAFIVSSLLIFVGLAILALLNVRNTLTTRSDRRALERIHHSATSRLGTKPIQASII